ncbi:hypothetical protein ACVDNC_001571 [Campylobacter jejuni]
MAENYIAENNLGGTREQQVAAAAKGLENLAAKKGGGGFARLVALC